MLHYHKGLYFKYLSIPVGLIIALTGFYLAYDAKKRNDNEVIKATQHAVELIQTQAKNIFSLHFSAIERMGKRWENNKGSSYQIWKEDAQVYIKDMPVFKAIMWINSDFILRWTIPLQDNKKIKT